MKLLIFHPWLNMKGGAERVVLEIAKHYGAKIFTVDFDKEKTFPEFVDMDITVLPRSGLSGLFGAVDKRIRDGYDYSNAYWNHIVKEDYDVLNAHGTPSEFIRNLNPRVLWYCHSPNREAFDLYQYRQKRRNPLSRAMMWGAVHAFKGMELSVVPKIEKIVANSENVRERINTYLGRNDAEVISPFVETSNYSEGNYGKYFFYPSRFTPVKRFDIVINAFKLFSKRQKGFKLVLAGYLDEKDSSYFEGLKLAASGFDIEFRTNPSEAEMKQLYAGCRAVLFAAVNEDFGLVPLEAGASKKPCIAVNEGGPKETILDGKTGFLITADAQSFADKFFVLAEKPELAEEMGKRAYKHISAYFSKKRFFEKFDKAIRQVAKLS